MRVSVAPHPCQHLLLSVFRILAIFIGMQWYPTVVLICDSLMTYDAQASFHMLVCHLHIFFGEVSVQISAHFLIGLFVFSLLSCQSSFHILDSSGFVLDVYPLMEILSGGYEKLSVDIYMCPVLCW